MNEQNTPNTEREKHEFLFGEEPSGGLLFEEAGTPTPESAQPVTEEEPQVANQPEEPAEVPAPEPAEKTDDILNLIRQPYMPTFTEVSENYRMAKPHTDAEKTAEVKVEAIRPDDLAQTAEDAPAYASDPTADEPYEKNETDAVVVKVGVDALKDEESSDLVLKKPHDAPKEADVREQRTLEDEKAELAELIGDYVSEPEPEPAPKHVKFEPKPKSEPEPTPVIPYAEPITIDMNGSQDVPAVPEDVLPIYTPPTHFPHREYCDESQKNGIKDRFIDRLMSLRVRLIFAVLLFLGCLFGETFLLAGHNLIELFGDTPFLAPEVFHEFVMAGCVFALILPEFIKNFKKLVLGRGSITFLPVLTCLFSALYYLILTLIEETDFVRFGTVNAAIAVSVLVAEIFELHADFRSFKTVSSSDEKFAATKTLTRTMPRENLALDGAVDELNSETVTVSKASFVTDFYANLRVGSENRKFNAILFALVFGVSAVTGLSVGFIQHGIGAGLSAAYISLVFGAPAFAVFSRKLPHLLTEKNLNADSATVVGEAALSAYAKADVFSFRDSEIFGEEGVSLKRMMLFGDSEEITDVLRKTASLFVDLGGPLETIFASSGRCERASDIVIEADGIRGILGGAAVCAGTEAFMKRMGVAVPEETAKEKEAEQDEKTRVMFCAENGRVMAKFFIHYAFSEDFAELLGGLREEKIVTLVYTRDPNMDADLLAALGVTDKEMRLMKLSQNDEIGTETPDRVSSPVVALNRKTNALSAILHARRFERFRLKLENYLLGFACAGLLAGGILAAAFGARLTLLLPLAYLLLQTLGFSALCLLTFRKSN
ncbi:MAG: hypothetical protein MJ082_04260 [Clostridia bacterium]|nr:hypothetical protein [Clostridia bacterium]